MLQQARRSLAGKKWPMLEGRSVFARRLTSQKRIVTGNTDIGVGLMAALDLLDDPRNCAMRRVIDVSGDRRETPLFRKGEKISLLQSVSRAKEMGVVINGLAITTNDPDLEEYFRTRVITGIGSFVTRRRLFRLCRCNEAQAAARSWSCQISR